MLVKSLTALLLAFILPLLWLAPSAAAGGTGSMSGSVIANDTQTAIENAQVSLHGDAGTQYAKTDARGRFRFDNLPAGNYTVSASATHYVPASSGLFAVQAGVNTELTILLELNTNAKISTIGQVVIQGHAGLNNSPATVYSVSAANAVSQGNLRLDQLIETIPGITILQFSGGGQNDPTFLTVRGASGSNENLVLQDGDPVVGPFGSVDLSAFTPAIYSRVESLEGLGATSLFGAASIGGTVNFVTREPLKNAGGQLLVSAGSYGITDYNAWYSASYGKFGFLIDQHGYNTDGRIPGNYVADFLPWTLLLTGSPNPTSFDASAIGFIGHPTYSYNDKSSLTKLRYNLSDATSVTLTASLNNDFRGSFETLTYIAPITINGVPHATDPLGHPYLLMAPSIFGFSQQNKYSVELRTRIGGGDLTLREHNQYYKDVDQSDMLVPGVICCVEQLLYSRTGGALVMYSKALGNHYLTISSGANGDYLFDAFSEANHPFTFATLGLDQGSSAELQRTYLMRDDFTWGPRLKVSASGTYSTYSNQGTKRFDPRLAFVYHPNIASLFRVSFGSGFAPPTLFNLHEPVSLQFGGFQTTPCPASEPNCTASGGNPFLQPETASGFDLGYEHTIGSRGKASLVYYRTNLTNQIYFAEAPAPPGLFFPNNTPVLYLLEPLNIGKSVYTGTQLTADIPVSPYVSLEPSYSVQSSYPVDPSSNLTSFNPQLHDHLQFVSVPLHQIKGTVRYRTNVGAEAYVTGIYFDNNNGYNLPAFTTYNAGVTLPVGGSQIHLVDSNIFNKNGFLFAGPPGSGVTSAGNMGAFPPQFTPYYPHTFMVTFDTSFGSLRQSARPTLAH